MAVHQNITKTGTTFAGIDVPPELSRSNFFFLFFNTLLMGLLMSVLAILQPAFLKDIIHVSADYFGSINGLLMNLNEISTLALVAIIGALSDKTGRKILAFLSFVVLGIFYYMLSFSNDIALGLHIPAGPAAKICALMSFAPNQAAEFVDFAPGLLITYVIRLVIGIGLVLGYPQFITMVADYTCEKDRGKGMGLNGLMMGISSLIIFAVFAPVVNTSGVASLFYIIIAIAAAGAACTWIFLKDRLPEVQARDAKLLEVLTIVRKSAALRATYLCTLITRADIVIMATFLVAWGVKIGDSYNLSAQAATQKAAIPMIVLSFFSFLSFPIAGILIDKWGRIQTIILALLSGGAGMLLLSTCSNPYGGPVFAAVIFIAFGMAGSITGANTLASDAAPQGRVGAVLGGLNTMQPIGILFFVGLGGYLFDTFSPGWAFAVKGAANIVLCLWFFIGKKNIISSAAGSEPV